MSSGSRENGHREASVPGPMPVDLGGYDVRDIELVVELCEVPNSAGIVIDAVRCCEPALDAACAGSLEGLSAYFMKSPARQYTDNDARRLTEEFISSYGRGSSEPSDRRAAAAQD